MKRFVLVYVALLTLCSVTARSQWSNNPAVNNPIGVGKSGRYDLFTITDAAGNTFVTWYDGSSDSKGGVYVQKITAAGSLAWTVGGVRVDSIPQTFQKPAMTSDGNGGVFVTWEDSRSDNPGPNIYGQHISTNGAVQWISNGLNLTASFTGELSFRQPANPQMLSDGSNGTYVSWDDAFGSVLMRVASNGSLTWATKVDTVYGATDTRITSDGSGGVILAWTDDRNITSGDLADIYAQRVNSSGTPMWTAGGVVVSNATNLQEYPQIVSDGSGGAVIALQDFRDGAHFQGYVQRLNASGVPQWTANGLALTTTGNSINNLVMCSDGAGGGILTWEESRGTGMSGSDNIYAQRVDVSGQLKWTSSGANVCVNTAPQEDPEITSDGSGGAVIVWDDNRNTGANIDIYAQRINGSGVAQWTADGVAVSSASGNQTEPVITPAANGAAVIFWYDFRTNGGNSNADIYGQYISGNGTVSVVREAKDALPVSFNLAQNFPNPFNPSTQIQFAVPRAGAVSLKVYDVLGREVATLVDQELAASSYSVTWNAGNAASGVYFYRLVAGSYSETKRMVLMK
ncbi:MAG TPA: T9SS type A sorting domain-containing protein [Bacteroidota bacterium]|nr:T9SS type A sorting domain-containing protein [Bacteroidota bacterium]